MVQKEGSAQGAGGTPSFPRPRGRPRKFDPDQALDRARDAFWNTGYAATSLDDISAATGLNRPSLYGAFGDKQALYLAALQKSRTELNASLARSLAPEEPLRDALTRVFGSAATIYASGDLGPRGCFLIGTAVAEAVADPVIRATLAEALAEVDAAFAARLLRAQAAGDLRPGAEPTALARLCTSTLNGMAVRARAGGSRAEVWAFGQALIDAIC